MKVGEMKVLIVAEDCKAIAAIAKELVVSTPCDITLVDTLEEADILTASKGFDLIIAAEALDDGSSLSLISKDEPSAAAPVIIVLDESARREQILAAVNAGAADVFAGPIDAKRVIASVKRIGRAQRKHRTATARSKRLRRLTSRLVRDRRELRQRVDLICRDLVLAYRRLAEKVVMSRREEPAADAQ